MTKRSLNVLLVEDSEDDAVLVLRELRRVFGTVRCTRVETAADLRVALAKGAWELVISDYRLPSFNGIAALALVRGRYPHLPFIMVSATVDPALAKAALAEGADGCIMKYDLKSLAPALRRLLPDVTTVPTAAAPA